MAVNYVWFLFTDYGIVKGLGWPDFHSGDMLVNFLPEFTFTCRIKSLYRKQKLVFTELRDYQVITSIIIMQLIKNPVFSNRQKGM